MKAQQPGKTSVGMKRSRRSWESKLRPELSPTLAPDPKGGGRMLFPTPLLLAAEIGKIPEGIVVTITELRTRMAASQGADRACPLMTGIFYNLVAGATEEYVESGRAPLAPYWRVIMADGTLSPKTPLGPERQAQRLREEGHKIVRRGKKLCVVPIQPV